MKNKIVKKNFEICVRGLVEYRGKILICRMKSRNFYFFPGGHVEFGEKAEKALFRELNEELKIKIKKIEFIGTTENVYTELGQKHHEINLVFSVLVDAVSEKSKEGHIDFVFVDKKKFRKIRVLPISLQRSLTRWFKDKKLFWTSQ